MPLQLFEHHPYFPTSEHSGFVIDDYWLIHLDQGVESARHDFNLPLPDHAPKAWLAQFFCELAAAPRLTLRADQWYSDHLSLLDGHVVQWQEDRKDGTDRIEKAIPMPEYMTPWIADDVRQWLLGLPGNRGGLI